MPTPIQLSPLALVGIVTGVAVTAFGAANIIGDSTDALWQSTCVILIVAGAATTATLVTASAVAERDKSTIRKLEASLTSIYHAVRDVKDNSGRSVLLQERIAEAVRGIAATYDEGAPGGDDSGPNRLYVAK